MKVVQNDIVSMDWDADGFIESKKAGFIAALQTYNGIAVVFKDGKIYTHILDDGTAMDAKSLVSAIKKAVKEDDSDYPEYYDDYVELFDGKEFEENNLSHFGIDLSNEADMLARLKDLDNYWNIVESAM